MSHEAQSVKVLATRWITGVLCPGWHCDNAMGAEGSFFKDKVAGA